MERVQQYMLDYVADRIDTFCLACYGSGENEVDVVNERRINISDYLFYLAHLWTEAGVSDGKAFCEGFNRKAPTLEERFIGNFTCAVYSPHNFF